MEIALDEELADIYVLLEKQERAALVEMLVKRQFWTSTAREIVGRLKKGKQIAEFTNSLPLDRVVEMLRASSDTLRSKIFNALPTLETVDLKKELKIHPHVASHSWNVVAGL
jgi:Mg/Co/Ni transporter MgtE